MSLERKYSKAVGAANRVVWTGREVIPVPFQLSGLVSDGAEFGVLRVAGKAMYCSGFTAYFQAPAADRLCRVSVEMQTGSGATVPRSVLNVNGVTMGGEIQFQPHLPMPVGSIWKLYVRTEAEDPAGLPQGLVVTYQLRYANGPIRTDFWNNGLVPDGIGFWDIGGTFVVT